MILVSSFYNWYRDMDSDNDQEAGIVNFDSMCGMDTAHDSIELIMSALKDWRASQGTGLPIGSQCGKAYALAGKPGESVS